ncbi:hypothetical protein [Krasilnikovia sp. MM14-A1259]|uniref:hypothetical protein n=1 Tax=Krasilnikovia sp. MM14-A1259 TaxID=3373539 RepID=UPI0037FEF5F6
MNAREELVWYAAIGMIEKARPLSDDERVMLHASSITAVVGALVLLEVPDQATRDLVDNAQREAIESALSVLAKGAVHVMTRVRPSLPEPSEDWLARAAAALRE